MFTKSDSKYLTRLIGRNEVVLFLGSGFSLDAKNLAGNNFPTANQLSLLLWDFLGYTEKYDNTPLATLFQAFIGQGVKRELKTNFLKDNLLASKDDIPEIYDQIIHPYWHKIYTTNVDDILDHVFKRNNKRLKNIIYPIDEYKERDQSLESTNIIYLHGKLPANPEDLIFSTKQYARASLKNQPLYGQFVYDYATHPTIFLGTELNEQLFEEYIESREGKKGFGELRPRSFLISPAISPVKAQVFKEQYNVHHIQGTTSDFLVWLRNITPDLPAKVEILRRTFPSLLNLLEYSTVANLPHKEVHEFAISFKRVPTSYKRSNSRSAYLLGANPNWVDIHNNLDIDRNQTPQLFNIAHDYCISKESVEKQQILALYGTAGSGKSTVLKRLGLNLSQNGITAFISDSEFIPKHYIISKVLSCIDEKVVLIFDNATNALSSLPSLIESISTLKYPPLILLSLRNNQKDKLNYHIDPDTSEVQTIYLSNLEDNEINLLIDKLDSHNLLGRLKGLNDKQRFREFKHRAHKQILVAMKEATNGYNFNQIIQSEFEEIDSNEAKILCLCVALNTELGYRNSKQDFIGFSNVSHIETLNILNSTLAGTVMPVGEVGEFMIRHRMLAEYMIKHCATLDMLKEAYIRVLSVLAPELVNRSGYTRKFNLYKSLVNHKTLFFRFKNDINHARDVYDSIIEYFDTDAHFWLQYASLEIEGLGGDLNLAENYLNQAESISPRYNYIQSAKCNLFYKISLTENDYSHSLEYKSKADELVEELISTDLRDDPHLMHIHCRGTYNYIQKWIKDRDQKVEELNKLRKKINHAVQLFPRDKKLEQASIAIKRAYLQLGINSESSIDPPSIN